MKERRVKRQRERKGEGTRNTTVIQLPNGLSQPIDLCSSVQLSFITAVDKKGSLYPLKVESTVKSHGCHCLERALSVVSVGDIRI